MPSAAKLMKSLCKDLFAIFSEPPPNFGGSKAKQMSAECKTKNEVFGFAYAECSQTYEKFVQGMFAIFSESPPNFGLSKVSKREQNTKRNRRFQVWFMPSAAKLM